MISIRQLRCIAALDETLHFRKAAERCFISQPALSNQIKQLEESLGVTLVERSKRRVLMTPLGHQVAERAKAILRDIEDLKDLTRAGRPLSGTLRLGVLPTLGPYLLPHILPQMRELYPELKLYLREEPSNRLLTELVHGELDLLLISLPRERRDLDQLPLFCEPFWAAMPLGHSLAAKSDLQRRDLAGEELILLEGELCLRDGGLRLCEESGAREHPDFRATSLDSLRQMVATGLGVSLMPALYVAAEAQDDKQIRVLPLRDQAGGLLPGRRIGLGRRLITSRTTCAVRRA